MILNPYYQTLEDWADSLTSFYVTSGVPSIKLEDPEHWQAWAMNFVGNQTELGQDAPDPYSFDDWREWGSRLFQTIDLAG